MCYSALIWANYRKYVRHFGADIDIHEFIALAERRLRSGRLAVPKALVDAFDHPQSEDEQTVKRLFDAWAGRDATKLQETLFTQRKRLADAERALSAKPTKSAAESKRIATKKIDHALLQLADLGRREPQERDSRIFPGSYCPVMVWEDGRRIIKPMRYQCRPAGKPAFFDSKFPGTYNARRDNLQGFWKGLFGGSHAIVVATSFFENVQRHRAEGRELREGEAAENAVLRFDPSGGEPMLLACLWSRWSSPGQEPLLSFAAITDDPPPEVAAAGHDRCVVPIRPENVDAWLRPSSSDFASLYSLLEDRVRPYYEHKLAA